MAPVAKKVIGVEIVEEAVVAARENAKQNGLENCEFIAGDVLKVLDEIEEKPDFIILDPPRDGVHPKAFPESSVMGWRSWYTFPANRRALRGIWRFSSQTAMRCSGVYLWISSLGQPGLRR